MKLIFNFLLFLVFIFQKVNCQSIINEDLRTSLESLYINNPKLKYERNILKAKDELMPQAFSEFRPEIKGYYEKGKVHTNSHGFNITSESLPSA